jgi:hypothetical protein
MQWYYSKNGTQLGPVEEGELRAKIGAGEVLPTDLVWREGMTDWLPMARVSELAVSGSPAASQDSGQLTGGMVNTPYAPPTHAYPVPVAPVPGSGKATASMVLGIVSLVFGICGCYGVAIALPCGILAIVFGGQVKKEAELNPALVVELSKAKSGVIMGWIGIALSVLLTLGLIGMGFASAFYQN